MYLASILTVVTYLISNEDQLVYASTLYPYKIIPDCYERANEIFVNLDADQFCIHIIPSMNEDCKILPKGVFVDIELSNFETNFVRMQEENFSYVETKQICGPCINSKGDNDCLFLLHTESARAMIRSYTREVELAVGKISIQHA